MRRLTEFGPSVVVLLTAALILLLGPRAVRELAFHQTEAKITRALNALDAGTVLDEMNEAYRNIAVMVEPSVVHISAFQRTPVPGGSSISSGSGWIYDADGYVVTNHHVIADVDRIDVQLNSGAIREAEIVGFDASTDIAVLKIEPDHLHAAVRAESSDEVRQGDLVFAFGSPFDFRFSISSGIVSGKGRHVGVIRDRIGNVGYENFIQVDAAINPGNSGGPLTDHRGRVIGMNTAIATGTNRGGLEEGQFAGIGLAIPLEMIEPVVDQIIEKGFVTKGFLGVEVDDLLPFDRRRLAFNGDGALIRNVQPSTPAFVSGVQADDIVVAVDGAPIGSRPQLQSKISSILPGDTVDLAIVRYDPVGQQCVEMTIPVMLTRLDSLRTRGELPHDHPREHLIELGIAAMRTNTPAMAAEKNLRFYEGVTIDHLVPGSGLDRRVPPGTTIISVRDYPVRNVEEFFDELRKHDLRVRFNRSRQPMGGVLVGMILPNGQHLATHLRYDG